ncbi:entry exclusion protein TrbK [Ensifer sp. Root423]|uniref:entry exclusion protein TrbK n=1 Tax=unclassified Ensifer TaxID=2633371 RepID=UPI00071455F6|nr:MULTISPECIES: entry exclusion protein TrbK [unclassified Ensifer]KQX03014.1 entry exclusion protein TrbK [Ensifer sp. Root423]MCY1744953.1 entry exclusion protein TrbK [Ensifer sp. SL37]
MVRTKIILVSLALTLAIISTGVWILMSEKQAAQERRAKFIGSSREYPTSGGEKMKIEW